MFVLCVFVCYVSLLRHSTEFLKDLFSCGCLLHALPLRLSAGSVTAQVFATLFQLNSRIVALRAELLQEVTDPGLKLLSPLVESSALELEHTLAREGSVARVRSDAELLLQLRELTVSVAHLDRLRLTRNPNFEGVRLVVPFLLRLRDPDVLDLHERLGLLVGQHVHALLLLDLHLIVSPPRELEGVALDVVFPLLLHRLHLPLLTLFGLLQQLPLVLLLLLSQERGLFLTLPPLFLLLAQLLLDAPLLLLRLGLGQGLLLFLPQAQLSLPLLLPFAARLLLPLPLLLLRLLRLLLRLLLQPFLLELPLELLLLLPSTLLLGLLLGLTLRPQPLLLLTQTTLLLLCLLHLLAQAFSLLRCCLTVNHASLALVLAALEFPAKLIPDLLSLFVGGQVVVNLGHVLHTNVFHKRHVFVGHTTLQ
eukprot:Hpha_TRINITY_DN15287_c1_g12::TRINITY_DN15287_c1_g12_i2::g.68051::m.68051